ncbi:alpha/beta hydrolase fold domain-containing protein [Clostridium sp. AL.422]|uniref:alpha/beta hydrolase n=1 Tax=Clostridium TaxID=1485 RepID=UPI00293DC702|nr:MULTISPECIES: alpha/beta hydrolase fold domain-containing protein [unclassified Clostridium]MDV4151344.1 alpha/beta hydrolase fold domain-containing protein [Clostridium sp. AL.422]
MKNKQKISSKNLYFFMAAIVIVTFSLSGCGLIRNKVKESSQTKLESLKDNENTKILDELNDEWVFPKGFKLENIELNGLNMNWVYAENSTTDKVILQLHGGAYRKSLADYPTMYQRTAVKYAEISGAKVLTIDYRVAPSNPFPAALDDAVAAYQWLLDSGYIAENIIIAGDSAGGGLTLATALYLRDNNIDMPVALITMSAWANLDYRKADVAYVGDNDPKNPYISPIYGDYAGMPQMLMQVGGDEVILKDTVTVTQKALKDGVDVIQTSYDGMFHDFQMLFPVNEQANKAWDEVEDYIKDIYK